jgi:hypothetical protein
LLEFFVGAGVGPDGVQAELVAGLEPRGDLFDGSVQFSVTENGRGGKGWTVNPEPEWPR